MVPPPVPSRMHSNPTVSAHRPRLGDDVFETVIRYVASWGTFAVRKVLIPEERGGHAK